MAQQTEGVPTPDDDGDLTPEPTIRELIQQVLCDLAWMRGYIAGSTARDDQADG